MRILIFNWKDIKNPEAGGAEVFTHEVARRWVTWGHSVTLFCRAFRGAPSAEEIQGVRLIRRGGRFSVYGESRRWYRTEGAGQFDIVFDEVNTRPFLTPRFIRDAPVAALIHQLAADIWSHEFPPPLGLVGRYLLEPIWLRHYRDVDVLTVSESTRNDLKALGLRCVRVVPEGLTLPEGFLAPPKENDPTLVFVGRLARSKRPDHAIEAFKLVRERLPEAKLWVVGTGHLRRSLHQVAPQGVVFFGNVSQEQKFHLLARAHALVAPSVREGWGLSVTEAGAVGTPAIGYDVPGLRDSIRHGETGLLTPQSPEALAMAILSLLQSKDSRERMGENARAWARTFSWERTASELLEVTAKLVAHD